VRVSRNETLGVVWRDGDLSTDKEFRRVRSVRVDRNNVHGYGKLFIVRYLFWNDHCAYPLGYVCDVIKTSEGEKYYSITYDVPPQHK